KPIPGQNNESLSSSKPAKKISYKEQRTLESQKHEFAELPKRIEKLETDVHMLTEEMATPAFYQQDSAKIAQVVNRLKEMQAELAQAYHRWEELEKLESS
ncbi:MAG TPA: hypothetical protein VFI68_14885, partial [Anaerolineales bacterium]|nr:hypothetical protein [Anaerolineales bacterium]